jgi:Tfp pilus assembly protein PilO
VKGRKIPSKAAIGLIVGGDLLLLLVGWFFLIAPQRNQAASIAQATAAAEVQLQQARQPVVHVKQTAVQQPEIKTADLYSLAKAMPSTVDMPNLLLELDQVARDAGVDLSTISPGAPATSPTDAFSTVPINLSFSGDFYSLTDMLYRLRTLVSVRNGALQTSGRLFSVGSVGIGHGGSGSQLNASVVVNAYIYAAAPAAPAVPVTPAAGSTDTTSTDTTSTATTPAPSTDVAP